MHMSQSRCRYERLTTDSPMPAVIILLSVHYYAISRRHNMRRLRRSSRPVVVAMRCRLIILGIPSVPIRRHNMHVLRLLCPRQHIVPRRQQDCRESDPLAPSHQLPVMLLFPLHQGDQQFQQPLCPSRSTTLSVGTTWRGLVAR